MSLSASVTLNLTKARASTGSTSIAPVVRKATGPARSSVRAGSVGGGLSTRAPVKTASPCAGVAAASGTPSRRRNFERLTSGTRLARYSRLSVRKANSSTSVTPGSLSPSCVHSGVCTGTRASVSRTRSW